MKMILEEIKKVFLDLGFEPIVIDNIEFMKLRESYCKITFINDFILS